MTIPTIVLNEVWAPKGHASPHLKETEDMRRRERPGKEKEEDKEREHA